MYHVWFISECLCTCLSALLYLLSALKNLFQLSLMQFLLLHLLYLLYCMYHVWIITECFCTCLSAFLYLLSDLKNLFQLSLMQFLLLLPLLALLHHVVLPLIHEPLGVGLILLSQPSVLVGLSLQGDVCLDLSWPCPQTPWPALPSCP